MIILLWRADSRTRTGDPRITNALLYQLSHIGRSPLAGAKVLILFCTCKFLAHYFRMNGVFSFIARLVDWNSPLAECIACLADTSLILIKPDASLCVKKIVTTMRAIT